MCVLENVEVVPQLVGFGGGQGEGEYSAVLTTMNTSVQL